MNFNYLLKHVSNCQEQESTLQVRPFESARVVSLSSSGTKERIAVISGTLHSVLTAVHLVLGKIKEETAGSEEDEPTADDDGNLRVKLCIPIRLCGAVIGKGGSTVRSFMEDCKADIR